MKDKLVRTGHKRAYYRLRAFSFALIAFAGASLAAATPIAISVGVAEAAPKAETRKDDPAEEKIEEEEISYTIDGVEINR